jgi:NurA-like 5'-3' nuclease
LPSERINDAWLFSLETLKNWGDRTVFFYSRRKNLSAFFTDSNGESTVGFVYLKTAGDSVPARVDVPAWIFRENLLDEVVDTIRAECVIGLGYPYALETADATAVISTRDREIFLRALQDFASRENLNFRVANKKMSKARRR